jgi:hypothetical protein
VSEKLHSNLTAVSKGPYMAMILEACAQNRELDQFMCIEKNGEVSGVRQG